MSTSSVTGEEEPFHPHFQLLFENDCMIVIHKPVDVAMDDPPETKNSCDALSSAPALSLPKRLTVSSWAYEYMKKKGIYDPEHDTLQQKKERKKQLKFVHQLDYATSGVLCLAFSKVAAAQLAHCFEMRTTQKWYVAVLVGGPAGVPVLAATAAAAEPSSPFARIMGTSPHTFLSAGPAAEAGGDEQSALGAGICFASAEQRTALLHAFYLGAARGNILLDEAPHRATVRQFLEPSSGMQVCDACRETLGAEVHPQLLALDESPGSASRSGAGCTLCSVAACFATHTLLDVHLPVGRDTSDPTAFRMRIGGAEMRAASTSMLVLEEGFAVSETTARGNPPHVRFVSGTAPPSGAQNAERAVKVLLMPRTGRRHQLRLHTWALGQPILGDATYASVPHPTRGPACPTTATVATGTNERRSAEEWPRMCLHAWRLALPLLLPSTEAKALAGAESDGSAKKRMRRERLGLEDPVANARQRRQWADFITMDPFQ
eukprot:gene5897-4213_t